MIADEDLHRHAMENIVQADALLFGRVTYEMMEAAWRLATRTVAMPDWTEPFARTIDAAKKYVVSSTLTASTSRSAVAMNPETVRSGGPAIDTRTRRQGRTSTSRSNTSPLELSPRPVCLATASHTQTRPSRHRVRR